MDWDGMGAYLEHVDSMVVAPIPQRGERVVV